MLNAAACEHAGGDRALSRLATNHEVGRGLLGATTRACYADPTIQETFSIPTLAPSSMTCRSARTTSAGRFLIT